MFKSTRNIDIMNHIDKLENKIDILVTNNSNTKNTLMENFMEIVKDTLHKETGLDIKETLVTFKTQLLSELRSDNTLRDDILRDIKDMLMLPSSIEPYLVTFKTQLLSELRSDNTLRDDILREVKDILREFLKVQNQPLQVIDHQEYHIKHQSMLSNIKGELNNLTETTHKLDKKLRDDLQNFLLGLQSNISVEFKKQSEINSQNFVDMNTNLKNDCYTVLQSVDAKVDGFYFENELIKHQLQLEEEIRKYSDDIDSLKIVINNTTSEIDKIFHHFDFNE